MSLHGASTEDIARVTLKMLARLKQIEAMTGTVDDRLKALDDLYMASGHLERMALREAAFLRVCGCSA